VRLGGLPVETSRHLAALYESDAGRLRLSLPFLVNGLRSAQPCFLVARGEVLDRYLEALRLEVDVDQAVTSGMLRVADGPGSTVEEALEFWEQGCWDALAKGSSVIRVVGEMASAREGFVSEREMLAFEVAVNLTFKRFPVVALCQYDVNAFTGAALMAALRSHPDLFELPLGRFLS
jgi:transcriptional repressor of dcmA and dcmR